MDKTLRTLDYFRIEGRKLGILLGNKVDKRSKFSKFVNIISFSPFSIMTLKSKGFRQLLTQKDDLGKFE